MSYDQALQPLDLDLDLEALERAVAPTLRERLARRRRLSLAWLRAHVLDLIILAVLLTVAFLVHVRGMYTSPARFDDEGTYTAYAWAVQTTHTLGHYTYWYAHPPLGWIQMAVWNWATQAFEHAPYAVAAVRQLMVVAKLASVGLLYGLALRLRMTRPAAVLAVLLFALSPLAVYFTRTALLDNIVTPWLLAAFYLAASPRRSLRSAAGGAACFAVAVLSKETALLFLPALALLFWQCADRRNRRFGVTVFATTLLVLVSAYPAYALIKNELFQGPGHVSLEWAVRWQLFDRQGSGSIVDPHSTAHAVASSWLALDPWLPKLALIALVPGLLMRRTRAVAIALGIQVGDLFRGGYLPYPFVVAMIPFAALTVAGVLDTAWQASSHRWPGRAGASRFGVWAHDDRLSRRSVLPGGWAIRRLRPAALATTVGVLVRLAAVGTVLVVGTAMSGPWRASLHDLQHRDRDAGAAAALAWVQANVDPGQRVVVDDAFWVDLVRHGYHRNRVIWFTKLDVDPAILIDTSPPWRGIDYVVLTFQDQMSLHMTLDGRPSKATLDQFPTLGHVLASARAVATFGAGIDAVTIWQRQPGPVTTAPLGSPL